jgi:dipeptidyl aminopeptidase/acylaminoacyl peptidase
MKYMTISIKNFINDKAEKNYLGISAICILLLITSTTTLATNVFSPQDLLNLSTCSEISMSADGKWIAYTVSKQRNAMDEPGGAYQELHIVSTQTGKSQPLITGEVTISSPRWNPKLAEIAFIMREEQSKIKQVWIISKAGGNSKQVTYSESNITFFRWHPNGQIIAYLAETPKTAREEKLEEKGYGFKFYEEDIKNRNLYLITVDKTSSYATARQVTKDITIWNFEFDPFGNYIAATASGKNLIDQRYMFRKIYLIYPQNQSINQISNNPGKLGNYAFSPDGSKIAYVAAPSREDHEESQVYVMDASGGNVINLTIPNFRGHVKGVGWDNLSTIMYYSEEGVHTTLRTVNITNSDQKLILTSEKNNFAFEWPKYSADMQHFAMIGHAPDIPEELFYWQRGKKVRRLTELNPWLSDRKLGKQSVIKYKARDGLEIEGILIYPVNYDVKTKYPLIVYVHGGPESHYSNGWMSSYSRPGQVMAGKEYVVFYPNYRASTGYGVQFSMEGFGDPAGKEFDDIADGIDYLAERGIADRERVGMTGRSYGGYASAWFATYYTQYVKAVCASVGISDIISKRGTTDIPYEVRYVHFGKSLEDMWDLSLKRSPIYWAHQSKTAVLITGGLSDTRVHPSQSLELYRRLKMNNHPAVRLVQYPGEKHGSKAQPARIDLMYRQILWFEWYVKDNKPLDGPMPPLDISEYYGLELNE